MSAVLLVPIRDRIYSDSAAALTGMHRTRTCFDIPGCCWFYGVCVNHTRVRAQFLSSPTFTHPSCFPSSPDYLQCCKFAEGDSRILMQKVGRELHPPSPLLPTPAVHFTRTANKEYGLFSIHMCMYPSDRYILHRHLYIP